MDDTKPSSKAKARDSTKSDDIAIDVPNEPNLDAVHKPRRAVLIERLRALRGTIPSEFRFDRDEANCR